ncbi:MAG TPA: hypothetical protein VGB18_00855, partial [Candidatus Thermoplasmatota archaeon]
HRRDDQGVPSSIVHILERHRDTRFDINIPEGLVTMLSLSEDTIFYTVATQERVLAREIPSGIARPMENDVSAAFMDEAIAIDMEVDATGNVLSLVAYDLQRGEYIGNVSLAPLDGPVGIGLSNFNEGVAHMYDGNSEAGHFAVDVRAQTVTPVVDPDMIRQMAASGSSLFWMDTGPHDGPLGRSVIYKASSANATPEPIRSPNRAVAMPVPQVRDGWILMADYDPSPNWLPAPEAILSLVLLLAAAALFRLRFIASR